MQAAITPRMQDMISREKDTKDVGRAMKVEMAALITMATVFIALSWAQAHVYATMWLIGSVFAFGIWRIGKADLH